MEILLKRSVNSALKLEMIYQANDGCISQRVITVRSYNEQHLIAYCHVRKQKRMFRRDSVLSLSKYDLRDSSRMVN
ncbi:hypothetical protein [Halalkalibacter krulwichiae]|uniref:WYL domain-containing protein n=1 Tax=Halalkalibacter krulwichiae TaxID=199441 RepID=A0A1X9M7R9_9BACI|nr:hypothetical protein [Halalkalibacter krulwichiae]ARK29457.1 hypothetical protein BkAM31D_06080 [Halalkalibacter krulwichiae]